MLLTCPCCACAPADCRRRGVANHAAAAPRAAGRRTDRPGVHLAQSVGLPPRLLVALAPQSRLAPALTASATLAASARVRLCLSLCLSLCFCLRHCLCRCHSCSDCAAIHSRWTASPLLMRTPAAAHRSGLLSSGAHRKACRAGAAGHGRGQRFSLVNVATALLSLPFAAFPTVSTSLFSLLCFV